MWVRSWLFVVLAACGGAAPEAPPEVEGEVAPAAPEAPALHGEAAAETPAPTFTVRADDGAERTAESLKGKPTVLWFYPKAGTPGCTIEGCGYRDLYDAFETFEVRIVGVSFDDPDANHAWKLQQKFPFELWSDTERVLGQHYGAATGSDAPMARRITVLLDAEGRWVRTYTGVSDDIGAHPQRVLEDVRQLFADSPAD